MSTYSAIFTGFGSHVPEHRLTNDDLSKMVDTNDQWIVQRTGIRERRIASESDTTASLATVAGRKAIESAGLEPSDIELIIVATMTPEMVFPATACFVGAALGMKGPGAFDVVAACSGFIYGANVGVNFVKTGQCRHVLVIGSETLSRITDYKDRSSCILFGDGAGAVVISRSTDPKRGWLYGSLHADGSGADAIKCIPGSRHPLTIEMLTEKFEELIQEAMRACELTNDQVKLIVPHQVNQRIIDSAMEKLGLPPEKAFVNIDRYGNTSAASIPIALDEAVRAGKLQQGDAVIFVAFGGGLTWANAVVRI